MAKKQKPFDLDQVITDDAERKAYIKRREKNAKISETMKLYNFGVKWTQAKTKAKLMEALELLISNENIATISKLAVELKVCTDWFIAREKRYKDDAELMDMIGFIRTVLESRVHDGGLNGTKNAPMCIFTLKAYHDKVEKQYIQTDNINQNWDNLTVQYLAPGEKPVAPKDPED